MTDGSPRRWLPGRDGGLRLLELFAACGFAIAQPLLSVYGRSPDEFIYRGATPKQMVAFAAAICFIPPIVLWAAESCVGLASRRALRGVHLVLIATSGALVATQVLKHATTTRGAPIIVVAVAVGAGSAWVYQRVRVARIWLAYASPAPIAFALIFLFGSSVAPLISSNSIGQVQAVSSPRDAEDMAPIVLVVFDEWPTSSIVGEDGAVDAALYPNLARLADTSTWYRNATTITNSTAYAVPTIFTGQFPHDGQIPEASAHPESLFTLLGGTHRASVSEVVTRVCPRSLCDSTSTPGVRGLLDLVGDATSVYGDMISPTDRGVDPTTRFREDEVEQEVTRAKAATGDADHFELDLEAATANVPQRFGDLLTSLHAGEGPTLHVLHVLLPHVPYRYVPDGLAYPAPPANFGTDRDTWTDQQWPPALGNERLLLQVGYVDQLIGELLDRLVATGLLDRSVVVVTADHGIAFAPGETVRGLSESPVPTSLYSPLLWSPLFVKTPGQTVGHVNDANVMSVDVVPTIAKALSITIPWKVDGVPAGERPTSEKLFFKATENPFGHALGSPLTFDGSSGFAQMLRRNVDTITPAGTRALRPFRVGDEGALVGRALRSVRIGDTATATARLENADALAHVDKDSGVVPALVWGTLDRSATVAVVVNGRIGGVSPTFDDGETAYRFAAMVPDRYLREGSNDVRLFAVVGTEADPVFQPIGYG